MAALLPEHEAWAVPVIVVGLFLITFLLVAFAYHLSHANRLHHALCQFEAAVPCEALVGDTVKVVGRVALHQGRTLTAPFTGRQCVFFSVHVEHVTTDVDALVSVSVAEEVLSVPFLLVPEGGAQQAVLVPSAAELGIGHDADEVFWLHTAPQEVSDGVRMSGLGLRRTKRSGIVDPLAVGTAEFLRRTLGQSEAARLLKDRRVLQYTEIAFEENHWLAALGQLRFHTNDTSGVTQWRTSADAVTEQPMFSAAGPLWSVGPVPAGAGLWDIGFQWGQGLLVSRALRAVRGRIVVSTEEAVTGRPTVRRGRSKRKVDQRDTSAFPSPEPSRLAMTGGGASSLPPVVQSGAALPERVDFFGAASLLVDPISAHNSSRCSSGHGTAGSSHPSRTRTATDMTASARPYTSLHLGVAPRTVSVPSIHIKPPPDTLPPLPAAFSAINLRLNSPHYAQPGQRWPGGVIGGGALTSVAAHSGALPTNGAAVGGASAALGTDVSPRSLSDLPLLLV